MSNTNPEIEAHMDALASICCDVLTGAETDVGERPDQLLKSLLMSGYVWKKNGSFQSDLESRVKAKCMDRAMHRGGALSSLSSKLSTKFSDLARRESLTPNNDSPPKAANISAATDA
ncbi:hypothetical protein [Stieleria varia]|uniref:Uncharacterized protein n=1 Tax=Stieleria varia TaxID=2528005 RepID=A0A5C6B8W2_9BACT|nr:hypothetical protein [Stieleria varia]TWU08408.1 hypothetical protein Pla52n_09910 [Stieleria varia]